MLREPSYVKSAKKLRTPMRTTNLSALRPLAGTMRFVSYWANPASAGKAIHIVLSHPHRRRVIYTYSILERQKPANELSPDALKNSESELNIYRRGRRSPRRRHDHSLEIIPGGYGKAACRSCGRARPGGRKTRGRGDGAGSGAVLVNVGRHASRARQSSTDLIDERRARHGVGGVHVNTAAQIRAGSEVSLGRAQQIDVIGRA